VFDALFHGVTACGFGALAYADVKAANERAAGWARTLNPSAAAFRLNLPPHSSENHA
jgi:hypothetical protein